MMLPQGKTVNVYFGPSSKDVSLSAKLLSPPLCENFQRDCVDCINFLAGEADNYCVEAVIGSPLKCDSFMV